MVSTVRIIRPIDSTRFSRAGDRVRAAASLAVGLVLIAALLAGGFDLHPVHSSLHGGHGATLEAHHGDLPVFSGAAHPDQAPHMEAAGTLLTSRCPACLLHVQSQADSRDARLRATAPAPSGSVRTTAGFPAARPSLLAGGSRAPPIG